MSGVCLDRRRPDPDPDMPAAALQSEIPELPSGAEKYEINRMHCNYIKLPYTCTHNYLAF